MEGHVLGFSTRDARLREPLYLATFRILMLAVQSGKNQLTQRQLVKSYIIYSFDHFDH